MIANSTSESDLCHKVQASIQRVADVQGLTCVQEEGKVVLRGQVGTREEALMCTVVARLVPGVTTVVSEIKVVA